MPMDNVHMNDSAAQLGRWKRFQQCLESSGLDRAVRFRALDNVLGYTLKFP